MTEKAVKTEENKALIPLETIKAGDVFNTENGVDELITRLKELTKPKLDITTKEGLEERRTLAASIASTKTGVFNMGKDYVAELKVITKAVDAKKRKWWDEVEAYQKAIRQPLTDSEEKEKERKAGHVDAMQQMRDLMAYDYEPDSADVEERIAKATAINERDFEEYAEQAQTVYENATGRLSEKLAYVIEAEAKEKELQELRDAAAAQKVKDDAAAVQAAADERAAEKVADDLAAANERADKAEQAAAQPAPVPTSSQPEQLALEPTPTPEPATAAPATTNTKEHKAGINRAIMAALVENCMISESAAKSVVIEIASNNIPNTTITY